MFRPSFANQMRYHIWMDDFDNFEADQWVITTTEAGAGNATETITNARGGILQVLNDDADDDADFFQWSGDDASGAVETWKYVAGKRLYFEMRVKMSEATQSDFIAGLVITDTTPLANTDGIYFQKDDGDALLDFHVNKNSTSTDKTGVATVVDDTWMVIAFYYTGGSSIRVYVNGVPVSTASITNVPDDEELTLTFGYQNGSAGAKSMSIDYIFVASERDSP